MNHTTVQTSKMLINEPPLVVQPSLAVTVGINEAHILQQLHYWLIGNSHEYPDTNGIIRKWVYNSYPEWRKQFPWISERQLQRFFRELEKKCLLITGNFNKKGFDKTKWYTIDYDRLNSMLSDIPKVVIHDANLSSRSRQNVVMDKDKLSSPIPENTNRIQHREGKPTPKNLSTKKEGSVAYNKELSKEDIQELSSRFYLSEDFIRSESEKAIDWLQSKGEKKSDYKAFFRNWLRKAKDWNKENGKTNGFRMLTDEEFNKLPQSATYVYLDELREYREQQRQKQEEENPNHFDNPPELDEYLQKMRELRSRSMNAKSGEL